jgi:hypothetical protein
MRNAIALILARGKGIVVNVFDITVQQVNYPRAISIQLSKKLTTAQLVII